MTRGIKEEGNYWNILPRRKQGNNEKSRRRDWMDHMNLSWSSCDAEGEGEGEGREKDLKPFSYTRESISLRPLLSLTSDIEFFLYILLLFCPYSSFLSPFFLLLSFHTFFPLDLMILSFWLFSLVWFGCYCFFVSEHNIFYICFFLCYFSHRYFFSLDWSFQVKYTVKTQVRGRQTDRQTEKPKNHAHIIPWARTRSRSMKWMAWSSQRKQRPVDSPSAKTMTKLVSFSSTSSECSFSCCKQFILICSS